MSGPIICVDTSEILEGKVGAVRNAIVDMVSFVEANEPEVIAHDVLINDAHTLMTVVQIHPDAASMVFHIESARSVFAPFQGLIRLATIDLYSEPSDHLRELLRRKAAMLGDADVCEHRLAGSVVRFAR